MKHNIFAFLLLAAAVLLSGCSQAPAPPVDNRAADAKAIEAVEEVAVKGWAARDAAQIGSIYAADAALIIPNMPTIKGSEVAGAMKEMLGDPNVTLKPVRTRTEVAMSGDIGYIQGTYEMTMTDPKTKKVLLEKGRYLTTFGKQADGSWKVVSDINAPDGAPQPVAK